MLHKAQSPHQAQIARNGLDFRRRAELSERMDEPCGREVMQAVLRDLARLNRWFLGYRPVLDWLKKMNGRTAGQPLRILDVGCGYGDGLRRIELWARVRGLAVELTGIDVNRDTIAIAREASGEESGIQWVAANVFEYKMARPAHVVVSSLFTHHLQDDDVVQFIEWMESHAEFGWFINDLSRAPVPYYLLRWFAKAARLHPFVQHDGPVSFLRSFVPGDWERLGAAAGLTKDEFEIVHYKPARLCVSRRKTA